MVNRTAVVAAIAVTSAVAFPYITALACNLIYGWPMKNRYRRAFSPKKVFALNISIIQKVITSLRYASQYFQWKAYYKSAPASEIMKDRMYGRNGRKLDLYFPKSHKEAGDSKSYPVVIFVYGGAWSTGSKDMYGMLCSSIANRLDAIVCCPDISIYPKGFIDNMTQDVLDSIIWLHHNVEFYKGDKTKLMLVGHSSGAHLCALSMLELVHDGLSHSRAENLLPITVSGIQFCERHFEYTRNGNQDNDDHYSTGSSGSFFVINGQNDNGGQASVQSGSPVLTAELVQAQKSETELSEGSMLESELRELTQSGAGAMRYTGTGSKRQEDDPEPLESGSVIKEGNVAGNTDESDDENSVVTVKHTDAGDFAAVFDNQPTRTELCRSLKAFVGLAGVYHIGDHFQHESSRGVEDVSCMTRAMRGQENFDKVSPTHLLSLVQEPGSVKFPKIVLLHGTEDYVVPVSSTAKFGEELLRLKADVTIRIIPSCDHYEICLDLTKPSSKFHDIVISIIETTAKSVFKE